MTAPRICCLDLDTFFVSVERLLDPSLEAKQVIVGGSKQRGVVTACSYEVRALGVRSGMSTRDAVRLAPNAIYLPTRADTYGGYSARVVDIARRYTPVVRVASIDEMYMDFAGCEGLYRKPEDADNDATILRVVTELIAEVKKEVGLPASAGIGTSKTMAKVACGLAKPAGILLVAAGREQEVLSPLPVRKLPGIGPVAEAKLIGAGINTLGELAATPMKTLKHVFGSWAEHVQRGTRGQGASELGTNRPAFQEHDPEGDIVGSISNERTFREDVRDPVTIDTQLCGLTERVCWRARKRGVKARTVTLKLRYADFHTICRSRTVAPTASELELYPVVQELYARGRTRKLPIRLLGLCLSNLGYFDEQLELFDDADEQLHKSVDALRERFGFDAIRLAGGRGKNVTSQKG